MQQNAIRGQLAELGSVPLACSRDGFISIMQHVRFDDKDTWAEQVKTDKFAAISDIWTRFNKNCAEFHSRGTHDHRWTGWTGKRRLFLSLLRNFISNSCSTRKYWHRDRLLQRLCQGLYRQHSARCKRAATGITAGLPCAKCREDGHWVCTRYYFYSAFIRSGFSSASLVSVNSGEDLLLDLCRSDQVKVIYRGKEICTVDEGLLNCTAEYEQRTSLTNTVLTLRGVKSRDGGVYIIQENNTDRDICTVLRRVSVSAETIRWVKSNQPAALPCKCNPASLAKWSWFSYPDYDHHTVAECNQTSCTLVKEGFNMSHDQHLKGDLTLTITAADDSMRGLYTCQCDEGDINIVDLSLSGSNSDVSSASLVSMNSGEDLLLDLHISDRMKVIYRGKAICTVESSLKCRDEYRLRTSLNKTVLTLRGVKPPDEGVYTIQHTENIKDLHICVITTIHSCRRLERNVLMNSSKLSESSCAVSCSLRLGSSPCWSM
ncbi:uncharacterized protein DAT39_021272, partial [Clarias magur]